MRIARLSPRLGVPFGIAVGGIFATTFAVLLLLLTVGRAEAHGIAGNRFFVGTVTFDDPAVNDELSSTFSALRRNAPGGTAVERQLTTETSRLLTPNLAIGAETSWIDRGGRNPSGATGFDGVRLNLKGLLYRDDPREMLLSAGLTWGLPGVGRRQLDAHGTIEPGLFFGKGFGDLPDSLAALRPFAITGAFGWELPTGRGPATDVLHWGASLQFSTLYLTNRFTGGPPAEEPLFQWLPLIEFAGDTPRNGKTGITANPGIAYVGDNYQLAAELILPFNREAGRAPGFMVKLLLFTDDLLPSLFRKPVFAD
jgi:hypothetical protein